ncbi:RNA polymerase sigma factor [Parasporobacterium paucivorans]|uniref:RNA polymerase sigma-70 factor, ECF subfamily n=1 Tax=Parasporobacterium paucivorans DSM 15970 TaxID=1122934 RepID=A0A1M6DKC6_9FIRM|nr:sigma-70 family RNA polymerase sigma factor [Parasporobacterium paucivorans]SHI73591.1 RNA polymerase sigma-70 factor, ECF subfamily [Parasporobacterium paucivorans DSM 15970]
MKDEKIIKLLKKRDEKGLQAISEKYERLLTYIASSILGSRSLDIEECVNDTYFKIWNNIERYDFKKASFKTYLKIIVRNTALNRIRDISRTEQVMLNADMDEVLMDYIDYYQNPEKKIMDREGVKLLESIIHDLNSVDKELVVRRYFYFQGSVEISQLMDMSVTAIDSRLSRLRKKIKKEYERREHDEGRVRG